MNGLDKSKKRRERLRSLKRHSHLKLVQEAMPDNKHLKGSIDEGAVLFSNMSHEYSQRITTFKPSINDDDVQNFIKCLDSNFDPFQKVLEPVFLSLLDGTMRAFKMGTKQGITASRLYNECKSFSYELPEKGMGMLDSYTEYQNEKENIAQYDSQSEFKTGKIFRDDSQVNMRDETKMSKAHSVHFNDERVAEDGYGGGDLIYENKTHAKGVDKEAQRTEIDHAVSCSEVCNKLKKNKGLTDSDIKDIVNVDDNLVATSFKNNRGAKIGKFSKSGADLQKEIDSGYVENSKGKKHYLSESEITTRKNMVKKIKAAQQVIDKETNKKVSENLKRNSEVQKKLASDASMAAANQSLGDLIILFIKPLYYELKDCFVQGIEGGVNAETFKSALSTRINRMKSYIYKQAANALGEGLLSFFKNFISMLLEGIVNCFVGIFKSVFRMMKEGIKALMQIMPILNDKKKSPSEKGDAILKLLASSLTIFASIGIESWLNSLGIGEPWSIIISSILTAVLTALTMYLLDKLDLFGVEEDARIAKVDELLTMKINDSKELMIKNLDALV